MVSAPVGLGCCPFLGGSSVLLIHCLLLLELFVGIYVLLSVSVLQPS